jgi:hypothetical protein
MEWVTLQIESGQLTMGKNRQGRLLHELDGLCGFAMNNGGMLTTLTLESIFTEVIVCDYVHWLHNDKGLHRTCIARKLSGIYVVCRSHPDLAHLNLNWWQNVIGEIPVEPVSALQDRKREARIDYRDLLTLVPRMEEDRLNTTNLDPVSLAWMAHDCLMMRFLVDLLWHPHVVRGAKEGQNIWNGRVTRGPNLVLPPEAEHEIQKHPGKHLWQFRFQAAETIGNHNVSGVFPDDLSHCIRDYLTQHRQHLPGCANGFLFVNKMGRPLTQLRFSAHVERITNQFFGRPLTPTSIRSSFEDYWLVEHPGDYEGLSNIFWVEYDSIRHRLDPDWKPTKQRRITARCA